MKIITRLCRDLAAFKRHRRAGFDNCDPLPPDTLVQNQDFDLSNPPPCPKCRSTEVARIVYGKPALTRQILESLGSGKIISGGGMMHQDAPEWLCRRCNRDFGQVKFAEHYSHRRKVERCKRKS